MVALGRDNKNLQSTQFQIWQVQSTDYKCSEYCCTWAHNCESICIVSQADFSFINLCKLYIGYTVVLNKLWHQLAQIKLHHHGHFVIMVILLFDHIVISVVVDCNSAVPLMFSLSHIIGKVWIAVSYTHLDVYKRQAGVVLFLSPIFVVGANSCKPTKLVLTKICRLHHRTSSWFPHFRLILVILPHFSRKPSRRPPTNCPPQSNKLAHFLDGSARFCVFVVSNVNFPSLKRIHKSALVLYHPVFFCSFRCRCFFFCPTTNNYQHRHHTQHLRGPKFITPSPRGTDLSPWYNPGSPYVVLTDWCPLVQSTFSRLHQQSQTTTRIVLSLIHI